MVDREAFDCGIFHGAVLGVVIGVVIGSALALVLLWIVGAFGA